MKTAVEWLQEMFNNSEIPNSSMLFEQAKEMEKEQIMDAINFGDERGKITTYKSAEQYYNDENVECTSTGIKALLQFKQQYQKLRSFKVIDNNEIIIKSNV